MSGNFDKSGPVDVIRASEAWDEYFLHYQTKYSKQLNILNQAIKEAAAKGESSVAFVMSNDYQTIAHDLRKNEAAEFANFINEYSLFLGYVITPGKSYQIWIRPDARYKGSKREIPYTESEDRKAKKIPFTKINPNIHSSSFIYPILFIKPLKQVYCYQIWSLHWNLQLPQEREPPRNARRVVITNPIEIAESIRRVGFN